MAASVAPANQADIHRCALKVQAMTHYAAMLQQGQDVEAAERMLIYLLEQAGDASPYAASFGAKERNAIIHAAIAEAAALPDQEELKTHQGMMELMKQETQKCSKNLVPVKKK